MTLYEILNDIVRGLPQGPKRYELHCHPSVYQRLRSEYSPPACDLVTIPSMPLYGVAEILIRSGYEPGQWRLYENGVLKKSGRFTE
jgi:hypothetical protein